MCIAAAAAPRVGRTGKKVVIQNVWLFEVASGRLAGAQFYADTAAVRSSAG
jgi:ketosteroid isomerase-like protein